MDASKSEETRSLAHMFGRLGRVDFGLGSDVSMSIRGRNRSVRNCSFIDFDGQRGASSVVSPVASSSYITRQYDHAHKAIELFITSGYISITPPLCSPKIATAG